MVNDQETGHSSASSSSSSSSASADVASVHGVISQSSEFEFGFDFVNFREHLHDEGPVSPRLICPNSPWRNPTATKSPNFEPEDRNPNFGLDLRNPSFGSGSVNPYFGAQPRNPSFRADSGNPNSLSVRELLAEDMGSNEGGTGFFFYSGAIHDSKQTKTYQKSPSFSSSSSSSSSASMTLQSRRSMDIAQLSGVFEMKSNPRDLTTNGRASFSNSQTKGQHGLSGARIEKLAKKAMAPSRSSSGDGGNNSNSANSTSGKLWAFKDLLRRTVPSSKYEVGSWRAASRPSSRRYLGGAESRTAPATPRSPRNNASPSPAPRPAPVLANATNHHIMPKSAKAPVSPLLIPAPAPFTTAAAAAKTPKSPASITTPKPPPKAPMSPHALHYTQQRAQAAHLKRKTYLPYRHSLLGGCLGHAFVSEHDASLVW